MDKLKTYLKSLSQRDRELLGHMVGYSGAYVTTLSYRKGNLAISLALAVAIDKISKGELDFRTMILRSEDVDWEYVREALNERPALLFVDNPEENQVETI